VENNSTSVFNFINIVLHTQISLIADVVIGEDSSRVTLVHTNLFILEVLPSIVAVII